jgi:hypothetical protein
MQTDRHSRERGFTMIELLVVTGDPHDVPAKAGGMTKTLYDDGLFGSDTVKWYLGASDATPDVHWTIDGDGVV